MRWVTVWKIFCLREKDNKKTFFWLIFYLNWRLSRLATFGAKFKTGRSYLSRDIGLDPREALTFPSAHTTLPGVIVMIKGSENRKKMQRKFCESQLTFLQKLLLTLCVFCGWILTSFLDFLQFLDQWACVKSHCLVNPPETTLAVRVWTVEGSTLLP